MFVTTNDRRVPTKMNSFFLSEANKLKNIQMFLEKNENYINILSKCGDNDDLCNFIIETENNRAAEIEKRNSELITIWKSLRTIKQILKEDIDSLDLNLFKKDMILIQEKIHNMKIKLKVSEQTLQDQEKELLEIVEAYNQKIPEWEKPSRIFSSIAYRANSCVNNIINSETNKEVKEFMDFVNKSNGHENGWSVDDHHLFLRLRNKHKDVDKLASSLNKILPDISPDDVKKHEIWYRKYVQLKTKKEEALEQWRQTKKVNSSQKDDNCSDENQQIPKFKSICRQAEKSVQEKLEMWKAEKEARRQEELALAQMQKERIKQLQEEKRKLHEETKQSVAQWKEGKQKKETIQKLQKEITEYQEKKIKALEANTMIKRFQSQDDMFIMKMRRNRLTKERNENESRRSKSNYIANRDPTRILKPTKQWMLRISKDNYINGDKQSFISNIREVPKLRMPEWRKNT